MSLLEELHDHPVVADGPMLDALSSAGAPSSACLEKLCVGAPEIVERAHDSFIAAGSRVIRTNSRGANRVLLARHGLAHHVGEFNWTASQLARDRARGKGVHVAGCVGPLGITEAEALAGRVDREEIFTEQIGALLDGGSQLIFLDAFADLGELLLAVHVKHSLHHCPVVATVISDAQGRMPDGMPIAEAFARMRSAEVDVLGIDTADPQIALGALGTVLEENAIAVFAGSDGMLAPDYAAAWPALIARGARLLGGSCGTGAPCLHALAESLSPR